MALVIKMTTDRKSTKGKWRVSLRFNPIIVETAMTITYSAMVIITLVFVLLSKLDYSPFVRFSHTRIVVER